MRVTAALQMPQMIRRLKDASWQRWRKRPILDTGIEAKLRQEGIPVVDANEFVRSQLQDLYPPDWSTLPDVESTFPNLPKNDSTHPDWHDKPRKVFDMSSFPIEGVRQAQVFSKAVKVKKGLPAEVLERGNSLEIDEELVIRVVKQAFIWDAYMEKLPKLRNLDIPSFTYRNNYGIPVKRSNDILSRNFLRLIESKVPVIAANRALTVEDEFRVNIDRYGEPVQFKMAPIMNVMSKKPLKSNVPSNTELTAKAELPDIFPFQSTANFEENNIYKADDFMPFTADSPYPYIHTSIISHHIPGSHTHIHPRWNDDRFAGSTIMYSFAAALSMARRIHGDNIIDVPSPVTSQIIHLTGKEVQFAVFQLNTLDLEESSSSKVKNIIWLTDKINLFENADNRLGLEILEGYNPEVFKTFAGLYLSETS